jgi:hypothetical protein
VIDGPRYFPARITRLVPLCKAQRLDFLGGGNYIKLLPTTRDSIPTFIYFQHYEDRQVFKW